MWDFLGIMRQQSFCQHKKKVMSRKRLKIHIFNPPPHIWLEHQMCDGQRDKCVRGNQQPATGDGGSVGKKRKRKISVVAQTKFTSLRLIQTRRSIQQHAAPPFQLSISSLAQNSCCLIISSFFSTPLLAIS